jgi:hypothetical protein
LVNHENSSENSGEEKSAKERRKKNAGEAMREQFVFSLPEPR